MGMARERPASFAQALHVARQILSANHDLVRKNLVDTEAEILVLEALRSQTGRTLSRVELFSKPNDSYPAAAGERLLILAGSRAQGKLLQHVTGFQVFLEHEYEVGPDVLIPRPETEILASQALGELRKGAPPVLGLEVGLGSGVLSIELLSAFPGLTMLATEISPPARDRARRNAERILSEGAARLRIVEVESEEAVLEPFEGPLQGRRAAFLISNPPYLSDAAGAGEIEPEVLAQEPRMALLAPAKNPFHFYEAIARGGARLLVPGGLVLVEMPHERADRIRTLFDQSDWLTSVTPDLSGRPRVLIAKSGVK